MTRMSAVGYWIVCVGRHYRCMYLFRSLGPIDVGFVNQQYACCMERPDSSKLKLLIHGDCMHMHPRIVNKITCRWLLMPALTRKDIRIVTTSLGETNADDVIGEQSRKACM